MIWFGPAMFWEDRQQGIKVDGDGEWNARERSGTKRRSWREIHIGTDAQRR